MKLQTNEQALTILQRLENLNTSVISLQNRKIEQQDLLIGNLRIMLESQEVDGQPFDSPGGTQAGSR